MQKSILSGLESILSVFYSASRYIVLLSLSVASVCLSEIYYNSQVVVLALCLYFTAVGISATAFINWLFGERK